MKMASWRCAIGVLGLLLSSGCGRDVAPGIAASAAGDAWYPCDGDTSAYAVVVTGSGSSWTIEGAGDGDREAAGSAGSIQAAIQAGFERLSPGRTTREAMLVRGDGTIAAGTSIPVPSYTILNLCGTIAVTGSGVGSRAPIYARGQTDIDIPHARITGSPAHGMLFRETSNVHLGSIELELAPGGNPGIGIRIDNGANARAGGDMVSNIRIDHLKVSGTLSQGLETYGVDGLRVGRVDATNTGESGVLLNRTIRAEIGVVHCEDCASIRDGYAAFRIANGAGLIDGDWPAGNIHVAEVYARNGGRGIFAVSGSGGLTIDRIDIADTGRNAILLQNCANTIIAGESGRVANGEVLLTNDTANTNSGKYLPSRNVTLQHLVLENATVREAWCALGDRGNRANDVTGGRVDMCFGE